MTALTSVFKNHVVALVKYSARAARALGFLKRAYNDVEIFVEDTSNHNMWLRLFQLLLPRGTRLSSVNLLGGRKAVVDACRIDQQVDGRRKLYVIDGDFDYAHRIRKPNLKYLYRMRAYCVENILLSTDAVLKIAEECVPSLTLAQLTATLDLDQLSKDCDALLRPLFALYAIVNRAAPAVQTVGYGIHRLLTQRSGEASLDQSKIRARMLGVAREARRAVGFAATESAFKAYRRNLRSVDTTKLVSGKDGILPVVLLRLRSRVNYRGTDEELKVRLSSFWDSRSEPWFARVVRSL